MSAEEDVDALNADGTMLDDFVDPEAEEDFDTGMRQLEIDRQVADADNDGKLTFEEFSNLVREREVGDHPEEELRGRFNEIDKDGSGAISLTEYLRWALKDALDRGGTRVMDLFRKWDKDDSGFIDKSEFVQALKALGYNYPSDAIGAVFDELDMDKGGSIDYKEMNKMLRRGGNLPANMQPGAVAIQTSRAGKHKLRRHENKKGQGTNVLGAGLTLELGEGADVQAQLRGRALQKLDAHHRPLPRVGRRRQRRGVQEGVWQGDAQDGALGGAGAEAGARQALRHVRSRRLG